LDTITSDGPNPVKKGNVVIFPDGGTIRPNVDEVVVHPMPNPKKGKSTSKYDEPDMKVPWFLMSPVLASLYNSNLEGNGNSQWTGSNLYMKGGQGSSGTTATEGCSEMTDVTDLLTAIGLQKGSVRVYQSALNMAKSINKGIKAGKEISHMTSDDEMNTGTGVKTKSNGQSYEDRTIMKADGKLPDTMFIKLTDSMAVFIKRKDTYYNEYYIKTK
jgi:hypothetical protein